MVIHNPLAFLGQPIVYESVFAEKSVALSSYLRLICRPVKGNPVRPTLSTRSRQHNLQGGANASKPVTQRRTSRKHPVHEQEPCMGAVQGRARLSEAVQTLSKADTMETFSRRCLHRLTILCQPALT